MEHSSLFCDCPWGEIQGFRSLIEFQKFERLLSEKLRAGEVVEVPVEQRYAGSDMLIERWFKFGDGDVWRLVEPDPPFQGIFVRI